MQTQFIFVILPEVHLLDLAGPDQVIHEAIEFGANFKLVYAGIQDDINTSAGLALKKQTHYSKINYNDGDFIVIPGARVAYLSSLEFRKNKDLFEWLKIAYERKCNIVSICAGAFVLGYAGLLNNKHCTTHFQLTSKIQSIFPKAKVKENILFVRDENVYTSAGIAAGIDLMLFIIEELTDGYFAHKVARELVIYVRRGGESAQENAFINYRNHIHSSIHTVQDFIIENIHVKSNLSFLAEKANMSERNFTRVFKKETGVTVNEFITTIRKEKLQVLLQNHNLSRKQIANQLGLESERQLSRILK